MSMINYASREINCKLVYYGPGLGGKTTNLEHIYQKVSPNTRGKMISLATETERTLFFDFLPVDLGTIRGFKTRFHLYTVPGQVYYNASRKLILKGVDGLVFVADSQIERMEANVESMQNLYDNMAEYGYDLTKHPPPRPHLPYARHRPPALHSGVLAQGHRLRHLPRGRVLRRHRRLPRAPPQPDLRARAAAGPDRRQAAPLRHPHPDLLAHPPSDHPRRLPHPVVGQLPGVGGAAARRAGAPDDRVPLLRQAARRGDPRGGRGEAEGRGAERLHRRHPLLVRLEGCARHSSLRGVVPHLLGPVPRRGRGTDARGRHPAHRLLARRVPGPLPPALEVKLDVVTVGTELLLGYTADANAAELGSALAAAGIEVVRRTTVADRPEAIRAAVADALQRTGMVVTTGGLGPTRDDVTKRVVAELCGKRLVQDAIVLSAIEARFKQLGRWPMPESNRSQAEVPEGATVLPNPRGTAPGLWLEDERGRLVVLLPGVPGEMRGLLAEQVLPRLAQPARADPPRGL